MIPEIDVFIVVADQTHKAYTSPVSVAHRLAYWNVRSVTVLDRSSGLTSKWRQEYDD